MSPKFLTNSLPQWNRRQSGLGLPAALFIILVMSLVAAAINRLNELNASAHGREWLSMRAFYMAESGAQAAVVHALNPAQPMAACNNGMLNNVTPNVAGLLSCRVTVDCETHVVDAQSYFTFTSTGRCGSGADATSRIIQVRIAQ